MTVPPMRKLPAPVNWYGMSGVTRTGSGEPLAVPEPKYEAWKELGWRLGPDHGPALGPGKDVPRGSRLHEAGVQIKVLVFGRAARLIADVVADTRPLTGRWSVVSEATGLPFPGKGLLGTWLGAIGLGPGWALRCLGLRGQGRGLRRWGRSSPFGSGGADVGRRCS